MSTSIGARIGAVLQILLLLLVIGYGTFELFRGNFVMLMATMPFLLIYYLFLASRRQRSEH